MLDKFMKKLKEFKSNKDNELMKFKLETVQGFFEMEDQNKWLKLNAITQNQVENAERFEEKIQSIMKKLYVPDYQSENV